ncbi:MAG: hypothetical protein LUE91_01325, partial [Oscillospiraceae bacterium]|nr:hypothetical protein [Oscillospiraceae bacterium]
FNRYGSFSVQLHFTIGHYSFSPFAPLFALGNTAQSGKSELRVKFPSEQGAKVQEYCMYFKLLQRGSGGNLPQDTAVRSVRCCLYTVLLLQQFQEDLPGGLGK